MSAIPYHLESGQALVMNLVFLLLILIAYCSAVWQQLVGSYDLDQVPMDLLTQVIFQSADDAISLAIGLIGIMAFFLGLMKVAEEAGLLQGLARILHPFLGRLFPDIPANHPAHGAMVMNISANMLGLGNAATPFGIKAMKEMESLNRTPGVASNAMILFLAINTSSVTLIPTKVIALRAAAGSSDPAGIIMTTLFATCVSTTVAITLCWLFARRQADSPTQINSQPPFWQGALILGGVMGLIPLFFMVGHVLSVWVIPTLTVFILLFGFLKKVAIYEVFTEGAKEGFWVAVKIMPYLAAILVAIGLLKASGTLEAFVHLIGPFTEKIGLPADALPMAFMRPLSGSGSLGVLSATLNDPAIGPDSYIGYLVSTMMGSTETTFYVLAVYFGAVQIKKIRYTLWVALAADIAGLIASAQIVRYYYG